MTRILILGHEDEIILLHGEVGREAAGQSWLSVEEMGKNERNRHQNSRKSLRMVVSKNP